MTKRFPFSILELFVVVFIVFVSSNLARPILDIVKDRSNKTKTMALAKNLGLIMISYAEDDIRANKMPYPLQKGKEKVWGNSKACWSTSVAEQLLSQKYLRNGEENQLKSAGITSSNYQSMILDDNTLEKNKFWNNKSPLDFHLYCDKNFTSNYSGKFVVIATYDNEDIRNCQFNGSGWVIFFADKTTEFVIRAKLQEYKMEETIPVVSVNTVEGSMVGAGIILRKDIKDIDGGPGTFGNKLGGGSTELMGKRDSDAIYQALTK